MKQLVVRIVRDLLMLPVTAVIVYLLVMSLEYKLDSDRKEKGGVTSQDEIAQVLGTGRLQDVLMPWQQLASGKSVAVRGTRFTAADFTEAVGVSLSLGALALLWAMLGAVGFALLRVAVAERRAGAALEIFPSLVFGSPIFVLAVAVALIADSVGVTFDGSHLLASLVMAIAPGTFIGVVLSDALKHERQRPYFVTALAKGCSHGRALWRHALPNALPALLDAIAPVASALLAGSFVAETFFRVKGFGLVYVNAASTVEQGVVVVATTIFASVLILVSLLVELLRRLVDPRARHPVAEVTRA